LLPPESNCSLLTKALHQTRVIPRSTHRSLRS
jgi:hypothetical protein